MLGNGEWVTHQRIIRSKPRVLVNPGSRIAPACLGIFKIYTRGHKKNKVLVSRRNFNSQPQLVSFGMWKFDFSWKSWYNIYTKVEREFNFITRCSLMVECLPSKQKTRVRFPLPGPWVRRQALKVTKTIGSPINGTLGGPTPNYGMAEWNKDVKSIGTTCGWNYAPNSFYAGIAQRQSIRLVSERSRYRNSLPAPLKLGVHSKSNLVNKNFFK